MTREGMESLLGLLRGHANQRPLSDSEFTALLRVASEENVFPLLVQRISALGIEFPSPQREQLREIKRKAQFSAFIWAESLRSTLAAFHRSGVPVTPLKGPCLAERLYGDVALRTYADLDLLVRPHDLARAEKLLTDLAFIPSGRADDYHRSWNRKAVNLELHRNVDNPLTFDFDVNAAWARAQPSQFSGVPVWIFHPSDELSFLCLHAVRHRFDRLCLLVDLGLAFRRFPLPPLAAAPHKAALCNVLALGWIMAAHLDPGIPALPDSFLHPSERARLEQLAGRLWQERMAEPAPRLDWAAQHSFYLEVETPGWPRIVRRWRHLRSLLWRIIDADYDFAARFHLHRDWQVRLLRPIRLLFSCDRFPSGTAPVKWVRRKSSFN